jgi:hypothetical protein
MYYPRHIIVVVLDFFSILINYLKECTELGLDMSFLDPKDVKNCKLQQLKDRAVQEIVSNEDS